jgi:predicted Zn-dependent protease
MLHTSRASTGRGGDGQRQVACVLAHQLLHAHASHSVRQLEQLDLERRANIALNHIGLGAQLRATNGDCANDRSRCERIADDG